MTPDTPVAPKPPASAAGDARCNPLAAGGSARGRPTVRKAGDPAVACDARVAGAGSTDGFTGSEGSGGGDGSDGDDDSDSADGVPVADAAGAAAETRGSLAGSGGGCNGIRADSDGMVTSSGARGSPRRRSVTESTEPCASAPGRVLSLPGASWGTSDAGRPDAGR
ncbi:hypothetical protein FAIPA1_40179 [Frankia sp. AiPs1]